MNRASLVWSMVFGLVVACGDSGGKGHTDAAVGDGDGDSDDAQDASVEGVCEGDRHAGDESAVVALLGCKTITGKLTFTGNTLLTVDLPNLVEVEGALGIWGNPVLTSVRLEKLTKVGGKVDVSFNEKLMTLSMPALASVNTRGDVAPSDLKITDNALLSSPPVTGSTSRAGCCVQARATSCGSTLS